MIYNVKVGDRVYEVEVNEISPMKFEVKVNGKSAIIEVTREVDLRRFEVRSEAPEIKVEEKPKVEKAGGNEIKAEMSGTIVRILVKEGDSVEKGQPVLILEAMKMENEIISPVSGVVSEIRVKEGDKVNAGQTLVVVSPG